MGPPRHLQPGHSDSGHGPFGKKAFNGTLIGCVVLVLIGLLMLVLGGGCAVPEPPLARGLVAAW